ncbi:MerR family transcriptional regulator [Actinomadura sp. B10D3]|uniref:MerR family transcriptional regulator n=1 Tax=Actinomadura sp. B10D3 TaxID=3153557 RepID=UPI00325D9B4B
MERTWTIGELAEDAAAALAADGSAQVSGRVRDLPNQRLIRWYTTIGLVDPPLGRRGRTSLYGPRHLLQLVAIKRRQAAGRSIAEIQLELAGATNATLAQIANLPAPLPIATEPSTGPLASTAARIAGADDETSTEPETPATAYAAPERSTPPAADSLGDETQPASTGEKARERESFWRARPDVSFRGATVADDYRVAHHTVVQGVRLVPGLTVLLDVPTLSGDDLAAIETAARPLLDELRRRGLLPAEDPTEVRVKGPVGDSAAAPATDPAGGSAGGSAEPPAFLPAAQPRRNQ